MTEELTSPWGSMKKPMAVSEHPKISMPTAVNCWSDSFLFIIEEMKKGEPERCSPPLMKLLFAEGIGADGEHPPRR